MPQNTIDPWPPRSQAQMDIQVYIYASTHIHTHVHASRHTNTLNPSSKTSELNQEEMLIKESIFTIYEKQ